MRRLAMAMAIAALLWPAASLAGDDDQRVANVLAANLKSSEELKGFQIKVLYRDGVARLEGWVRNKQQAKTAETIVHRTPEVQRVLNQLEIKGEPAAPVAPAGVVPASAAPVSATRPQRLPPAPERAPGVGGQGPMLESPAMRSALRSPRESARPEPVVGQRAPLARAPRVSPPSPQTPVFAAPSRPQGRPAPMPAARPVSARVDANGWGRATAGAAPSAQSRRPQPAPMPMAHPQEAYYQQAYPMPYQVANYQQPMNGAMPVPAHVPGVGGGVAPAMYDQPYLPNYAWPSYAAYPNYAALTYPKQYSPTAWPYIGPFYPYPQVPLGWRKVTLEWDDGWWFLDFSDDRRHGSGR